MTEYAKTYLACFRCKGEGTEAEHIEGEDLIPERECPYCGGDGVKSISHMVDISDMSDVLDNILDKVKDIKDKVKDIKEKLDEL